MSEKDATSQEGEEAPRVAAFHAIYGQKADLFDNPEGYAFASDVADAVTATLATQPVASQESDVDQRADDYAADYVMTTEGNDYVPTEWERELIIDALHGFIADHWNEALATTPARNTSQIGHSRIKLLSSYDDASR